jgi:hypothetical protein
VTTNATWIEWTTVKKFESPIAAYPVFTYPYNPNLVGVWGPIPETYGPTIGHWWGIPTQQVLFQRKTNLTGLATDYDGHVYIADPVQNRILKVISYTPNMPNGTLIAVYGPGIVATPPVASPPKISTNLLQPEGIAVDSCNGLFIVDTGNNRIVKIDTESGKVRAIFGNYGSLPGQFNSPSGVAVDGNGFVYVTDTNNNRVQKFASVNRNC